MGNESMDEGGARGSMDHLPGVVKGAAINLGGAVAGKVLALGYTVFIARMLTTADMGLYQLGITVFSMVGALALLGMDSGLIRYIPIFHAKQQWTRMRGAVRLTHGMAWGLGGGLALILVVAAEPLARGFFDKPEFQPVLLGLAPAIPFFAATTILLAATQARGKMQYKVYVQQMGEPLIRFILTGTLFLAGWRLWGVVASFALSTVLGTLLSFIFQRRLFRNPPGPAVVPPEWKQMVTFSLPQTLSRLFLQAVMWTDILMLGYLASSKEVGLYGVASRTAILATLVLDAFIIVFAPMISRYHETGAMEKLRVGFQSVTKWGFTVSLPALLLFLVLPGEVLGVYGSPYREGAVCLILLSCAQLVHIGSGPAGQMIVMSGRPWFGLANNLTVALLNVILNWTLIPRFGIAGAATATMASLVVLNLSRLVAVRWMLSLSPFRATFLKPVAAGAVAALATALVGRGLEAYPPAVVILAAFAALSMVYIALLYWMGFDEEDQLILARIRARLAGVGR